MSEVSIRIEGRAGRITLTRPQALRLIAAESYARRVTVMPRSGR